MISSGGETVISPDGTEKQKRVYRSFTSDIPGPKGKREAERMASVWAARKETASKTNKTLGETLDKSPKSVRDIHGLLSAVLKHYRPEFALNTTLPQKIPPKIYIPSEEDIRRVIKQVEGTEMEIPVLLAAFGPMRRGKQLFFRTMQHEKQHK